MAEEEQFAPEDDYAIRAIKSPKWAAEIFARIVPLLANPQYRTAFYQRLAAHKDD
jgi:hypothetical protein